VTGDTRPARPGLDRGLHAIVVLLSACAIGATVGFIALLPSWLAAAAVGHVDATPAIWFTVALAVSSALAAFGLWRSRPWGRDVFFLWAFIASVWQLAVIVTSGAAAGASGLGWLALAGVALGALAFAGVLVLYVWRHARPGA
jgi:O-antigen/teichoic acid export membrane protein